MNVFKNDPEKVYNWLKSKGVRHNWHKSTEDFEAINMIAAACMSVYEPLPGDATCIGFFPFSEVMNGDGSPAPDHYRNSEGMCIRLGDDNECAIGIRSSVLKDNFVYAAVGVGLHNVAHMRFEEHTDEFMQYLMGLQFAFCEKAKKENAE